MQMNGNAERLNRSFAELTELQLVLERAQGFFDDQQQFRNRGAFESTSNGALSGLAKAALLYSPIESAWRVVKARLL